MSVVGYKPQYNATRGLWYVDVALDPGIHFWPFLRLAVCRYQPESIPGCHLSAPVRCDFVQLPPERLTSVSRTDDRHVRVVTSGTVGVRARPGQIQGDRRALANAVDRNRYLIARLQRRDPLIDTDLGWETIIAKRMVLRGRGTNEHEVAWVTELEAGEDIQLSRPGHGPGAWRVAVEEWEMLEGDPTHIDFLLADIDIPRPEYRLIYAEEIDL